MTLSEIKRAVGSQPQNNKASIADQRFLTFTLAKESYGVPLPKVKEVIAYCPITSVPSTPHYFSGIMNLRGQVISIIDLRLKLRVAAAPISPETAIIILELDSVCMGIIIDSVDAVLAISRDQISEAPEIESSIDTAYITGVARVNKSLILTLDIEKVLSPEDLDAMKSQNSDLQAG